MINNVRGQSRVSVYVRGCRPRLLCVYGVYTREKGGAARYTWKREEEEEAHRGGCIRVLDVCIGVGRETSIRGRGMARPRSGTRDKGEKMEG